MVFSSVVARLFISDSGLSTNYKQPVAGIEVGISFHTEGVRTEAVGRKAVSTAKKKLSGWGESWPRGRNFPVFPLVAIHDWTEKSQSVGELSSNEPGRQLSVGGGGGEGTSVEVLSPGFFYSMPGRTFKSKRGCSRRKQQLRRRSPFLPSFARCRRSRSRCQSLYHSCLRTIEELIKIIASHSITYPPFVLHLFSFSNVFQHCILPPPIFLAVRTSTYRINETTLSSNLSSIKHPKKKKRILSIRWRVSFSLPLLLETR